jgi:hypothetical protein
LLQPTQFDAFVKNDIFQDERILFYLVALTSTTDVNLAIIGREKIEVKISHAILQLPSVLAVLNQK